MAKLHVLAFLVTLAGLSVSARELKLNIGGGGGSTEEEVHVVLEGLSGDVNVTIDSLGIPHISCVEDMDCFQAQGYFAARDRFGGAVICNFNLTTESVSGFTSNDVELSFVFPLTYSL